MKWIVLELFVAFTVVCCCFSASLPVPEEADEDDPRQRLPRPQRVNILGGRGRSQHSNSRPNHSNNGLHRGTGNGNGNGNRQNAPGRQLASPQRRPVPVRQQPASSHQQLQQTESSNQLAREATTVVAPPESLDTVKSWEEWLGVWERNQEDCGLPSTEPFLKDLRVAGGTTAMSGNWPWMVSLSNKMFHQHWCGGILISDQWVLTAAHCLFSVPPPLWGEASWTVRLGKQIIGELEETEQDFNVSRLMVHPGFDSRMVLSREAVSPPSDHDLALVKLDGRAERTPWVRPACLPEDGSGPAARERCVVTGWGFTSNDPPPSQTLQQGVVPVMALRDCKNLEGYEELLTQNMICAGYEDGGVDACRFDSGGPLQCQYGDKWYAVGVTSWGDSNGGGCARAMRPGVYTRVGNYIEWIQETVYADFAGLPQISWERIIPNPLKPQK